MVRAGRGLGEEEEGKGVGVAEGPRAGRATGRNCFVLSLGPQKLISKYTGCGSGTYLANLPPHPFRIVFT